MSTYLPIKNKRNGEKMKLLLYLSLPFFLICTILNAQQMNTLSLIQPDEKHGYNYPYFLFIPKNVEKQTVLMVVPNNTGTVSDTLKVHEDEARELASRYYIGGALAEKLKLPVLVPVFPRPESQWKIYTHALDRDTIMITEGEMKRLDMQLIEMINDARERLYKMGITTNEKIFLNGFSASGTFVNRFTILHPEKVLAAASGGVNGVCILPFAELKGKTLEYPIGTADYEKITGRRFDIAQYMQVPQFIYMGEKDENDATLYKDSYSQDESGLICELLGKKMMPDRFEACISLYLQANLKAVEFKIYPGLAHKVDKNIFADLCSFFQKHMADLNSGD